MDKGFSMGPVYRSAVLAFFVIIFILFQNFFDNRTVVVFCDVGQADGAYIRVKNKIDIVIDAGQDRKILDCLGKYMPFYDRTIELAFNTHPQRDHYGGYLYLLERYQIKTILMSPLDSEAVTFEKIQKLLGNYHVRIKHLYAGQTIQIGSSTFTSLWPRKQFVSQNIGGDEDKDKFYSISRDPNDFSQIVLFKENETEILFTGDINTSLLTKSNSDLPKADILKVPHHGSKNGMDELFLTSVKPQQAIISSGKNNRYGHPSPEIIKMLEKYHVRTRRTDTEGDIVLRF